MHRAAHEIADAGGLTKQIEDPIVVFHLDHQISGIQLAFLLDALAVAHLGDALHRDDDLAVILFQPLDLDAAFDGFLDRFLAAALHLDDIPVFIARRRPDRRRFRLGGGFRDRWWPFDSGSRRVGCGHGRLGAGSSGTCFGQDLRGRRLRERHGSSWTDFRRRGRRHRGRADQGLSDFLSWRELFASASEDGSEASPRSLRALVLASGVVLWDTLNTPIGFQLSTDFQTRSI